MTSFFINLLRMTDHRNVRLHIIAAVFVQIDSIWRRTDFTVAMIVKNIISDGSRKV